jgi:ABC-type polar amino acid transport system ATPase subunit
MGCCTNIDYLARVLIGEDYTRQRVVLTYNWIDVTDFAVAVQALDTAGVAFDPESKTGVVIAVEDVARCGAIDYMVVGHDVAHARELEKRALVAFGVA